MSFAKVFRNALGRTLDAAKNNTTAMLRMDVDPTAATRGSLPLWQIKRQEDLADFAVGCDKDMGGLSSMKIDLAQGSPGKKTIYAPKASSESLFGDSSGESEKLDDSQQAPPTPSFEPEPTHHARFFGTLSSQVPRGAGLERSGYAAFRNKVRPTLFGSQTWDASLYSYLAFRVRNNAALPSSADADHSHIPSLTDILGGSSGSRTAAQRARSALGYGVPEPPGPKFFVNIQTDGPLASDLYQHRLWLNPAKGNAWQTVIVPLDAFLLLTQGTVNVAQVAMLKQGLRTVGISSVLEGPMLSPQAKEQLQKEQGEGQTRQGEPSTSTSSTQQSPLSRLEEQQVEASAAADAGSPQDKRAAAAQSTSTPSALARGSKRGHAHRFDLSVAGVDAVGSVEEGLELWQ